MQVLHDGMDRFDVRSGRCQALARIVFRVAAGRDAPMGRQVYPRGGWWVVPRIPNPPQWATHTFVETREHSVDAMTGPAGHAAERYLPDYWQHHEYLAIRDVDVTSVDPGIQEEP